MLQLVVLELLQKLVDELLLLLLVLSVLLAARCRWRRRQWLGKLLLHGCRLVQNLVGVVLHVSRVAYLARQGVDGG